ncbi:sialidase-3-like [Tachysurus fulvidraco]|uniref:sialidase-3-like n=1 Tax=Tachysurus fulvidraco TaxID=1234273 RepID=UPI001FEDD189|nr:sialidase-3-like [Tachysurus fulvidraco]WPX93418.1 sialidase-3-like protein [Tachysurus fulvidraco]
MGNSKGGDTEMPELSPTALFINTFYRIPALIYIDQTFLAFAEKRTSLKDEDAELLVLNRGTRLQDGSVKWSGVRELTEAQMPGHRTMNPCPVYDERNKRLFLFFNCLYDRISEQHQIRTGKNAAKLCYITSSDKGESWTKLIDLTERVIGDEILNWATFSVGPGHGLQMTDGRLIVPAYAYYNYWLWVTPYSFAFYSDDGANWRFGKKLSVTSTECEMAEVEIKGKKVLYCSARGTKGYRVEALSEDRGESFQVIQSNSKLVEPPSGCQGSVVSFQHEDKTWLMFSHTTDKKDRMNLGIYLNKTPEDPSGWTEPKIINPCSSAYSDVVQCDQDNFACLLERKTVNCEEITFVEFKLSDIKPNL